MPKDEFPWIPFLVIGGLVSYVMGRSNKKDASMPAVPQKTRRELELERQQQEEWEHRRAQAQHEREVREQDIMQQAEEARAEGHTVCNDCLPHRLTLDQGETCTSCWYDWQEEQRRITDD